MLGVISFITNRSWIDGSTFAPMRNWVSTRASHIQITDFGPGTRGGSAGAWSDQPFAIETGTAIVTVTFDPGKPAGEIHYQRATWTGDAITQEDNQSVKADRFEAAKAKNKKSSPVVGDRSWVPSERFRSLLSGLEATTGVVTGEDARWIQIENNRDFKTRHAYRVFDNRWSPTNPPPKARRGAVPEPGQAKPSAFWRQATLFDSHKAHVRSGGWYAILQRDASANPGPAIKATKHVPDFHLFKGSEAGWVYPVGSTSVIPSDYEDWASSHALGAPQFWKYALAAGNHCDYWTGGTNMAAQLAIHSVEVPLSDVAESIRKLVKLGTELIELWSLDTVKPIKFEGSPGAWKFDRHDEADALVVSGRKALAEWRKKRQDNWTKSTATEYARSVAAILRVRQIADEVADLFP